MLTAQMSGLGAGGGDAQPPSLSLEQAGCRGLDEARATSSGSTWKRRSVEEKITQQKITIPHVI